MNSDTFEILKRTSTASLATLLFKKGLRNQYVQGVSRLNPMTVFQDPDHPQRKAVEEIPEGYVLVMDCRQQQSVARLTAQGLVAAIKTSTTQRAFSVNGKNRGKQRGIIG